MAGWDWLDTIVNAGGKALDWLGDNPWAAELGSDLVKRSLYDRPELSIDELRQAAIQDAVINSPDVYTPQGQSVTTIDPETGKRVVRQEYSPEVQSLYEMLVRNAGAPIEGYAAPESMRGQMLGGMINERERHMGLPESEWTAPTFTRPGADFGNFWDSQGGTSPEDPDPAPVMDPSDVYEGYNPWLESATGGGLDPLFSGFLVSQLGAGGAAGQPDFDITQAINDYVATGTRKGSRSAGFNPKSGFEAWAIDHADELAGILGKIGSKMTNVPLLGTALNKAVDYIVGKLFYDKGGSLRNLADVPDSLIDQALEEFLKSEQSGLDEGDTTHLFPGGGAEGGQPGLDGSGGNFSPYSRDDFGLSPDVRTRLWRTYA